MGSNLIFTPSLRKMKNGLVSLGWGTLLNLDHGEWSLKLLEALLRCHLTSVSHIFAKCCLYTLFFYKNKVYKNV